eukprot:scaffold5372_cov114-Isochrysis_galbana.AAC.11
MEDCHPAEQEPEGIHRSGECGIRQGGVDAHRRGACLVGESGARFFRRELRHYAFDDTQTPRG